MRTLQVSRYGLSLLQNSMAIYPRDIKVKLFFKLVVQDQQFSMLICMFYDDYPTKKNIEHNVYLIKLYCSSDFRDYNGYPNVCKYQSIRDFGIKGSYLPLYSVADTTL